MSVIPPTPEPRTRLRPRPRPRPRSGLALRAALLATAVATLTVVLTGVIFLRLIGGAADDQARRALGRQADLVAQFYDRPAKTVEFRPGVGRMLVAQQITVIRLDGDGVVTSSWGPRGAGRAELSGEVLARLSAGDPVGRAATVTGRRVNIAARPLTDGGAVALVQPASQGRELSVPVSRRLAIALVVALCAATAMGLLLARRLARPLRAMAGAAHELAAGRRDVRVEVYGPAEIADVGEALNHLIAALAISEERQREFLLSVSHELRTPLTAIRGFAEALVDEVTPADSVAATGRVLLAEALRLDRLVRDLLDLARLGADDFRIDLDAVDLSAVVSAAAQVWERRCAAEGVELRMEIPSGPLDAVTDAARCRQIIDGLAENALRVVPAGAPIVFALRKEGAHIVIEVRDGGPGLTPEDLAVAFDRSVLYERYRGIRPVSTGLGLALVASLAARLGGHAEAGVAAEGGAAFAIRLPTTSIRAPRADRRLS
ncbi:HAMP domain-containing sensor histidine kinase [Frankia sp. Cas4]|uniref:HAMP domain-containing sensor histidine kinase n=1 Tax=Frankia sp. Cas4 TaxID=3073927 RepID=UPI002AD2A7CE|nr:HAMP domain-containing sensor histidine kinase [Frankia sp. Cas4]